jgi:hypothetical protein
LAIRQKLADETPTITLAQDSLATSFFNIANVHRAMGQSTEFIESYQKALAIRSRLAHANPP